MQVLAISNVTLIDGDRGTTTIPSDCFSGSLSNAQSADAVVVDRVARR